jgi:hypothetical protein
VGAHPVGERLDEGRAAAGPGALQRLGGHGVGGQDVVAVDPDARHAEAEALAASTRDAMNEEPELDPLELFAHVYAAPRAALLEQRDFLARELGDS